KFNVEVDTIKPNPEDSQQTKQPHKTNPKQSQHKKKKKKKTTKPPLSNKQKTKNNITETQSSAI
ncbi:hypothetical protein, partial [Salmonella sp. s51090]|uniref:hypothetical protein n=1 Tax=Salmonella sp. s51090 TaxID=3159651 RepID=UPI0039807685